MGKQKEIEKVQGMVYQVLLEDPAARDSDEYLVAKILDKVLKGSEKEYKAIYLLENFERLTGFHVETVRRTRQKLQADYPELWGSRRVRMFRKKNIIAFIKYSRQGRKDGEFCFL